MSENGVKMVYSLNIHQFTRGNIFFAGYLLGLTWGKILRGKYKRGRGNAQQTTFVFRQICCKIWLPNFVRVNFFDKKPKISRQIFTPSFLPHLEFPHKFWICHRGTYAKKSLTFEKKQRSSHI